LDARAKPVIVVLLDVKTSGIVVVAFVVLKKEGLMEGLDAIPRRDKL